MRDLTELELPDRGSVTTRAQLEQRLADAAIELAKLAHSTDRVFVGPPTRCMQGGELRPGRAVFIEVADGIAVGVFMASANDAFVSKRWRNELRRRFTTVRTFGDEDELTTAVRKTWPKTPR